MEKEGPMMNMSALESYEVKSRLAAIGLDPICEWVIYGCQADNKNMAGALIIAFAKMLADYLPDIPTKKTQLRGTPYAKSVRMEDNLDSNGCVEYKATLEPAFRITARFGPDGYGKHCWCTSWVCMHNQHKKMWCRSPTCARSLSQAPLIFKTCSRFDMVVHAMYAITSDLNLKYVMVEIVRICPEWFCNLLVQLYGGQESYDRTSHALVCGSDCMGTTCESWLH